AYDDPLLTLTALAEELERNPVLPIADLAWAHGRRWRQHIAQAFDDMQVRQFARRIGRIEVETAGTRPSMLGWLMAGWLRSRLAHVDGTVPDVAVSSNPAAHLDRSGELDGVRLFATTDAHRATISIMRAGPSIQTLVHIDGGVAASHAVPYRIPELPRLLGTLLEETPEHPAYREAVRAALRLATGF
ncbi:MAG: OpcA/G6PD domain-containing protein, partial [Candidatus Dormibacteria bacterium]